MIARKVATELRKKGASVHLLPELNQMLVGYHGETYVLATKPSPSISQWRGRPIPVVKTVDAALSEIGIGDRWAKYRRMRDAHIQKAIIKLYRYRSARGEFHATELFPFQDIYKSIRGLQRTLTNMAQRGLLVRYDRRRGYKLAS